MPNLRRLFRSNSCSSTRAVKDAVAAFLMPLLAAAVLPLGCGVDDLLGFSLLSPSLTTSKEVVGSTSTVAILPLLAALFFFRFLPDPDAFFNECVKPCSFNDLARAVKRSTSAEKAGSIGMIFSAEKGSLHCPSCQYTYMHILSNLGECICGTYI